MVGYPTVAGRRGKPEAIRSDDLFRALAGYGNYQGMSPPNKPFAQEPGSQPKSRANYSKLGSSSASSTVFGVWWEGNGR